MIGVALGVAVVVTFGLLGLWLLAVEEKRGGVLR